MRALCKTFGLLQAVDHLTLSVEPGEIFGLLGPNGSGKTTTINLISGLSTPTSGEVQVMGYDVRRHARRIRQMLGTVPQETALYEELSGWDNLDFHADLFGMPRKEKKARIMQMLELVQLQERKRSRVSTFSGGMKRRLALARALLHDPHLLYLDEPTLGVDVQSRRAIWDYILSLRDQDKTVLITTNYLEEAQALCERIAILDHGKLIAVDTPEHLKQTYGGSVVELETAETSKIVAVVTIPANFDTRIRRHQSVAVGVKINNLNTDFTNDIRRALPLSITGFYANAEPSVVTITPQERDAYPQDLGYIPYLAVPILVIGLMVEGMVQAGTAAAVEWERETMKELLLSPASRVAILLGKMLAAFLIGLAGAAIVLAVLIMAMGIRPVHWGELIGFTLLILALFTAWGTLLGMWLQRRTPVATLAIGLCVPLFFLSGPFGPISFFAPIEQVVARVFPVYFAIVVLQHAVHDFTLNTSAIGINVLILAAYALIGQMLATIVVRRSTLARLQ